MYYMKNSLEKKWCPCKDVEPQSVVYAKMDKPKIPIYGPVNIKLSQCPPRRKRYVLSSQMVAPDSNVNIPSGTVERYTGFVPYSARSVAVKRRERFDEGENLSIDYGNAISPPEKPALVTSQQYDAALASFYAALNLPIPENKYDFDAPQTMIGPIPIEATAYASLPAEYVENFTPVQVNRYGTVSRWR